MVHPPTQEPLQVPRGTKEHSLSLPSSSQSVNFAPRRPHRTMSSFHSDYESLQDSLTDIKQLFDKIDDATTRLLSISSYDEITKVATSTTSVLIDAQVIADRYRKQVEELKAAIAAMDSNDEIAKEQAHFEEQMKSTDGSSTLPIGNVSLLSLWGEKETRYNITLATTLKRVNLFTSHPQLSSSSPTPPPISVPPLSSPPSTGGVIDQAATISSSPPTGVHSASSPSSHEDNIISQLQHSLSQIVTHITPRSNIALPPVKLETFDGTDLTRWPAYKYQLDQLILNQPHLSEVEKAYHVRSSLRGMAFQLVAAIPVHENFLAKIISRLESQFSRDSLSQAKLIQSLRSIRSKSSLVTDQLTAVQSMITLAHAIHTQSGVDAPCMQQMIAEGVHSRFITLIARRKPATLLAALELIEDELLTEHEDALTISAYSSMHQAAPDSSNNSDPNLTETHHVSRQLHQQHIPPSVKSPKKYQPQCVFCGNHSYSGECTQVPSVKERKTILNSKALCHCCFTSTHSTDECQRSCSTCKGNHHRSLCDKAAALSTSTNTITVNDHSMQVNTRLLTTHVALANEVAYHATYASLLLDPGSQVYLISRDLVRRLHLVPVGQQLISVDGIKGAHHTSDPPSLHDIVQFELLSNKGKRTIKALVRDTESITGSITYQPLPPDDLTVIESTLKSIPPHLSDTVVTPELIIGVGDALGLLANAKSTTLPSGYQLIEAAIGPLVAGSLLTTPSVSHDKETSPSSPSLRVLSASTTAETPHTQSVPHPPIINDPLPFSHSFLPLEDSTVTQCNFNQVHQSHISFMPPRKSNQLKSSVHHTTNEKPSLKLNANHVTPFTLSDIHDQTTTHSRPSSILRLSNDASFAIASPAKVNVDPPWK